MAQVCRGLHFAHERRIVHRDMKPSNIRVLEDGTAKIMDFGIAKLGASGVTKSGMMVGTVHYMSPEQISGKTLDGRSDVFSMGVILYQLLTGERPFPGEHPTEILYKIVHNAPPPLAVDLSAVRSRAVRGARPRAGQGRRPAPSERRRPWPTTLRIASDHLRGTRTPSAEISESVSASRRLLVEGRVEEGVRRLREVTTTAIRTRSRPSARSASRRRRCSCASWRPEETAEVYPELAVTYQPAATQVGARRPRRCFRRRPRSRPVRRPRVSTCSGGSGGPAPRRSSPWQSGSCSAAGRTRRPSRPAIPHGPRRRGPSRRRDPRRPRAP